MRLSVNLLALGALASSLAACAVPTADSESDSSKQSLVGASLRWPQDSLGWYNVPVCWDAASVSRADFQVLSKRIRRLAIASWPTVTRVNLTGWGTCTGSIQNIVLRLSDTQRSDADGLGYNCYGNRTLTFKATDAQMSAGLVPHLFGLALGFAKENDRTDLPPGFPARCGSAATAGTGLGSITQPDLASVMTTVGTDANGDCKYGSATLSRLDAAAASRSYAPRVLNFLPLATWWDGSFNDHHTALMENPPAGRAAYLHGWAPNNSSTTTGTVSLKVYRSSRGEYATVAAGGGTEAELTARGNYTFDDWAGAAFPTNEPGTVPLYQMYSAARDDYFLATPSAGFSEAVAAGYEFKRVEGYIFENLPYTMLGGWWSPGRADNLTTAVDSTLAANADDAGYQYFGFDVPIYRYPISGTVPFDTYWSASRLDHVQLADPLTRAGVEGSGVYTYVGTEGYVRSDGAGAVLPIKSYWSNARTEHFTPGRPAFQQSAIDAGYSFVRIEGYGIDQLWPGW